MSSRSHTQESHVQPIDRQPIRKAYSPPTVTLFGSLTELTNSLNPPGDDLIHTGSK
jgi:hypothetical protein